MSFTKYELQSLHNVVERAIMGSLARPYSTGEINELRDLFLRVKLELDHVKPTYEKGRLVLSWRLPKEWAPSLNSYAFMKGWQRTALRKQLDDSLFKASQSQRSMLFGAKLQRWVRVTRFTSKPGDENSVDVLGGKMPVDALVRGEVLVDDDQQWCIREGLTRQTKRGNTHVLVEVFEVTTEGGYDPPPRDDVAPKAPERKKRIIDE